VHAVALRAASREQRHRLACAIREALNPCWCGTNPRVEANRDLLAEIGAKLEDEALMLDPCAAIALDRLLTAGECNLYSPCLPADELRSRLRRIADAFAATI
jgi:hypothetical protein